MSSVCLRGERDAEQIEGAALGLGGGGKAGGEAIAPKAYDIAGERGEIAKQGMEAVHREWFAICRVSAFANGLALRRRRGLGLGHRRDALRLAGPPWPLPHRRRSYPNLLQRHDCSSAADGVL